MTHKSNPFLPVGVGERVLFLIDYTKSDMKAIFPEIPPGKSVLKNLHVLVEEMVREITSLDPDQLELIFGRFVETENISLVGPGVSVICHESHGDRITYVSRGDIVTLEKHGIVFRFFATVGENCQSSG